MQINKVEGLGDIVAYKPKEIQVQKHVYERVPVEFQADFDMKLEEAYTTYKRLVEEAKARGERPASALIKKSTIADILKPFLSIHGIELTLPGSTERKSKPSTPKPRKSLVVEDELDLSDLDGVFSNFDSEALMDDAPVSLDEVEGGTILGNDLSLDTTLDLFDGDVFDGIDFESLL